jgi:hypothetical protein
LFAAAEVAAAGCGGLKGVAGITGLARSTINRGKDDLDAEPLQKGRIRRAGGGRKAVAANDPGLVYELKRLVEPATLGDTMRRLIWVSKSMDKLAPALTAAGHTIRADTVKKGLVKVGSSRQFNRKADEGSNHPDRDAQFEQISAKVIAMQEAGHPVISLSDSRISEPQSVRDGAEVFEAVAEGYRTRRFGLRVAVPAAELGDDPGRPRHGFARVRVLLQCGCAFDLRRQVFEGRYFFAREGDLGGLRGPAVARLNQLHDRAGGARGDGGQLINRSAFSNWLSSSCRPGL